MENNFWIARGENLFDLRCSLRGKELEIVSKDMQTNLNMRFDDFPLTTFKDKLTTAFVKSRKYIQSRTAEQPLDASSIDEFISYIGSPKSVPTWTVKGRLSWGKVHLDIGALGIEDLRNHSFFGMNFVIGKKTAFGFQDGSMVFGVAEN